MSNSAFSPSVLTVPSTGTTGSGQGELNLITNPVAAVNLDGWVGAGRGTSGGPLSPTIDTYFTVLNTAGSESSTTGAYDVLSLPSGLQNKKLKVEFYFTSPANDTFKVSVYKGTTRVPLTTDVSGSTSLPKSTTGKFVAYFDTDSSGTWTVSITRTAGTGAIALQFTNVVVGPGIQPQGAVVGEWTSFTPSSSQGFGTLSSLSFFYKREGSDILIRGAVQTGTSTATTAYLGLPAGLTTSGGLGGANRAAGTWQIDNSTASTRKSGVILSAPNSTVFYFTSDDYANAVGPFTGLNGSSVTAGTASTTLEVDCRIPIAEWAGSGTVQLAQNDVEFSSNSNATNTATDTTSFVYGPSGSSIPNGATGTTYSRTVQFQTPIQVGDKLELEYSSDRVKWIPMPFPRMSQGVTNDYGATVFASGVNTASVFFYAGGYSANNATYGGLGQAWSTISTAYWRVRKSSAGAAVGFGIVQPGVSSGLVSASGLPGNTTGNVVAAGYVGEVFSNTGTGVSVPTTGWTNIATITLTAGTWSIGTTTRAGGVVNATYLQSGIATASASSTGLVFGDTAGNVTISATADGSISLPNVIKTISASTQYWLVAQAGGATLSCAGRITAIRIA